MNVCGQRLKAKEVNLQKVSNEVLPEKRGLILLRVMSKCSGFYP